MNICGAPVCGSPLPCPQLTNALGQCGQHGVRPGVAGIGPSSRAKSEGPATTTYGGGAAKAISDFKRWLAKQVDLSDAYLRMIAGQAAELLLCATCGRALNVAGTCPEHGAPADPPPLPKFAALGVRPGAARPVGPGRIFGYLSVHGDEGSANAHRQYVTGATDLGAAKALPLRVLHGDGGAELGVWRPLRRDHIGLAAYGVVGPDHPASAKLMALAGLGAVAISAEADPGTAAFVQTGATKRVDVFNLTGAALLPRPADPRQGGGLDRDAVAELWSRALGYHARGA